MKNIWKGKYGPLLIAEIGANHEGSFSYAKKLLKKAFLSDVDAIKFQIYRGSTLCNRKLIPNTYNRMKSFELTTQQHIYLADQCRERGFLYSASVWDTADINLIQNKIDFFKIGSGDLTSYHHIKEICKYKKPILISTGLANLKEIKNTLNFIKSQSYFYSKKENIAVMQCTSSYPTKISDINLGLIELIKKLGHTVGYSHHNKNNYPLELAHFLGAKVLEFHFTDNRTNREFRDHEISLTYSLVKKLINKIKLLNLIKGDMNKKIALNSELLNKVNLRRALYLNKNKKKILLFMKQILLA